ncbi:MAG: ABC-F family ATP-binding cassette domain-containing protein, partial [Muribaculaceae bacterium]|nr:ABC-F family ATP-binding cassette domain-containing protein [Muribaculaceae bacterium]
VKCIMNEIPYDGSLRIGHNVKIGYFAQNQAQLLDGELTVFDTIDRVAVGDIRTRIRDLLGTFMFYGDDIDKKVKVLSGGEKSRLAMIRLLLEPVNLLILDEPTNHLDIDTKAILKRALKQFNGTAIIVSHDRDFLSGLVDRVFEFGGGKVRECLGGIGEFLSRLKRANTPEAQVSSAVSEKNAPSTKKNDETLQQKKELQRLSYREERERAKLLKQAQRKVDEAEAEITAIEAEIAEIERKISEGETDNAIFESHAAATKRLENAMSLWEIASMNLSELQERFAAG